MSHYPIGSLLVPADQFVYCTTLPLPHAIRPRMPINYYLGVDTGGTFTDFVLLHRSVLRVHKVLSTPEAPAEAIRQGVHELELDGPLRLGEVAVIHGTTVATNTALEGKGVRTAYVTNRGLGDLLTIGRQIRREIYDLQPKPLPPPVAPELIIETGGRLGADGEEIEPLTEADLAALSERLRELRPESVAINLLFSFVDERFERMIEARVAPGIFVSRSSHVLPEYREYERGIATWLNGWLGPIIQRYISQLSDVLKPSPLAIMQSSGGTISSRQAATRAVNLLLSGPAGGLAAARHIGGLNDQSRLITFDMGGTSTDVALIDGEIRLTSEGHIGPYPVAIPMTDIHTIGAGGGSIAYVDEGGLLQVGPESAGAAPGPACYGKGGTRATVTDANTVLGRLRPDTFLGGRMTLDFAAAQSAIERVALQLGLGIEETAEGIVAVANEKMTQALRAISIQRGHDPEAFRLVCFGGAGGLHFCALAEALQIRQALIPRFGGVLSALGMLVAPPTRQFSRTHRMPLRELDDGAMGELFAQLRAAGAQELIDEQVDPATITEAPSLDLRYVGQSYTLNLPWAGLAEAERAFHDQHEARYGHCLELPVELLNLRLSLSATPPPISLPDLSPQPAPTPSARLRLFGFEQQVALYDRDQLGPGSRIEGPALVTEMVATTLIHPGWSVVVDRYGNLLLTRSKEGPEGRGPGRIT